MTGFHLPPHYQPIRELLNQFTELSARVKKLEESNMTAEQFGMLFQVLFDINTQFRDLNSNISKLTSAVEKLSTTKVLIPKAKTEFKSNV
jgi:hypothetical protein